MDPSAGGVDVWKMPKSKTDDPSTWQLVMENIPYGEVGAAKADQPWVYNFISDGEKLFGKNQPHMVMPGDTSW